MSIEVKNLTKLYGEQKALDNVSFSLAKGEIVGFLGPNGAGKSTMMKILTGYIPPSEGEAFVGELDVQAEGIEVRKKVGYRQRAGLAAALIHEPEVLILDEPTTGLDVNQLVEIRQLIKEAGKNKTVMLSTHIMQEVEYLCDRVIIINKGKIVADRPIADLQNLKPEAQYRVEFDKTFTKSELRKITGISKIEENGTNRWLLEAKAVENQAAVLEMQKQSLSLEDIFKELTN